jgi:ribosomal protein S18 acetylase RimI-like enzyme
MSVTTGEAEGTTGLALPETRHVDIEAEVALCYGLMRQLRPHLASEQEFVARWRQQAVVGYRLLAIWQGLNPIALAGYRVQDNLMHARHLYVDDLVTDAALRSGGYGGMLMERLKAEGRTLGCAKLVLDTALANTLGQRFYYRQGPAGDGTALQYASGMKPERLLAMDYENNCASRVMNGSSVISSRSGVTEIRLLAMADKSVPLAGSGRSRRANATQ